MELWQVAVAVSLPFAYFAAMSVIVGVAHLADKIGK